MNLRRRKAFTLLEIMIVVAVIGFLALLAIPNILRAREKTRLSLCFNNQRVIHDAVAQYSLTEGTTYNNEWGNPQELNSTLVGYGYITNEKTFDCFADGKGDNDDYYIAWESWGGGSNTTGAEPPPSGEQWWIRCNASKGKHDRYPK